MARAFHPLKPASKTLLRMRVQGTLMIQDMNGTRSLRASGATARRVMQIPSRRQRQQTYTWAIPQVSADFWVPESCSTWPDWADSTEYPMAKGSTQSRERREGNHHSMPLS
eukprot:CAMPEP_0174293696 /NCGR_PEP_ID=MMETSP0809-20121228/39435_1 /TAXON_ID=73025 ORGANISM="Eutreptiella gymnastica-like, Strain CCMP1594" /NCGR_SAMPLE_ID=MMETSP0809 /ASSEMBLY_ACC=CAM_ASM_000658 /LENGTH=110 /DNA_ID=CAMNT_0015394679 /DNA_START=1 /DNA_END=333 /DNA_ORIENTATION=+